MQTATLDDPDAFPPEREIWTGEKLAWEVLRAGLADLIATDHHADSRVVSLRAAVEAVARRGSGDVARLLGAENPARVLRNEDLLPVPSLPVWKSA